MSMWRYKCSLPVNIVSCINERLLVSDDEYRDQLSCRIYHQLVLQESFVFKHVWTKLANQSVCIGLDRRIYFNFHRQCYYNDGPNGVPQLLYNSPTEKSKVWAAILYHCQIVIIGDLSQVIIGDLSFICTWTQTNRFCLHSPFYGESIELLSVHVFIASLNEWVGCIQRVTINRRKSPSPEEQGACLIVLTSDGYLKLLDADTGQIIRIIYISTDIVFRYLDWADYLNTIQIKSVKAIRQTPPRQQMLNSSVTDQDRGRVMSLLVFKIHPLNLFTYFHIEKCVFGDNVRDAGITEDLLMIVTHNNTCQYYDLHWIINNCTKHKVNLNEPIKIGNSSMFCPGVYPNSIPVTVQMTEAPPLLFTTNCIPEIGVSFGGNPFVYIHHGYSRNINEFHIRELQNEKLVKTLKTEIAAFHQDVVEFHFDDYRRILHISGCTVSCYQLRQLPNKLDLQLIYFIDFKQMFQMDVEMPLVSARGRTIKPTKTPPSYFSDFSSALQDLDYENELDLLYAVITLPEGEETKAMLCFINELKGTVDKIVPLPTWDPSAGNSIYYELDCILHLVQKPSHNTCHFYRLTRTE